MTTMQANRTSLAGLDDAQLTQRVGAGDVQAFEMLMRRHNRRLFRIARAILKDDAEAEDALQESYLAAYRGIGAFRGASALGTWLARIVINESFARLRKRRRAEVAMPFAGSDAADAAEGEITEMADEPMARPETSALRSELRTLLERRIDELPLNFRTAFVLRDVEEMSVEETADALGIPAPTVRTRHFRARALLRAALSRDLDAATVDAFGFDGARCDRIVASTLARIAASEAKA